MKLGWTRAARAADRKTLRPECGKMLSVAKAAAGLLFVAKASVDLCWTILDYVVCCSAKRCTDQGWMLKCYALRYRMLIHVEFCSMECRICCGIRCRHILVMLDVGKYCILHHQIKKIYVLMLLYRTLQRRTIKHFCYNLNHMKTNVRFGIK